MEEKSKMAMCKLNIKNKKKFDDFIHQSMFELGGGYAVTINELFHFIKRDLKTYKILGKNRNKLEDRRQIMDYDCFVPNIRDSIHRLQKKGLAK